MTGSDDAVRARVGGVVRALIKQGFLVEVEERDAVRRELATFVRAA